jgi:hypothetical protein
MRVRWDAMRVRVLGGGKVSAEGLGGKPGTGVLGLTAGAGVLGLTAGAGVLAPSEKRGRRCEPFERD